MPSWTVPGTSIAVGTVGEKGCGRQIEPGSTLTDLRYVQVQGEGCKKVLFLVIATGISPRRLNARALTKRVRVDRRHRATVVDSTIIVTMLWMRSQSGPPVLDGGR